MINHNYSELRSEPIHKDRGLIRLIFLSLLLILIVRLLSLSALDITDPSEGRYALIAQQMLISNDWVTQNLFTAGQIEPFLGKPPMHSWLTALSLKLFGMNEFAARFPSFISLLLSALLSAWFAKKIFGTFVAALSLIVLTSSGLFFIISGTCLTDPVLCFASTAAGVAIAFTQIPSFSLRQRKIASYGFFAALAVGMLVKGPLIVVLVGVALVPWVFFNWQAISVRSLPWFSGGLLFLALTVPWYLMVERANPGFLRYFFVNENFLRFLIKDYGDKYGSAHTHVRGTIWLMLLAASLPWSLIVLCRARHYRAAWSSIMQDKWLLFCVCWGLAPTVFFTLGSQVSIYYVLPGLPWLAISTAVILDRWLHDAAPTFQRSLRVILIFNICISLIGIFFVALNFSAIRLSFTFVVLSLFYLSLIYFNRTILREVKPLLVCCALSFVYVYYSLNICIASFLNQKHSSKRAIQQLITANSSSSSAAAFYKKIPYSAYFYLRDSGQTDSAWKLVKSASHMPLDLREILVRNKDLREFEERKVPGFEQIWSDHGWGVWRRIGEKKATSFAN